MGFCKSFAEDVDHHVAYSIKAIAQRTEIRLGSRELLFCNGCDKLTGIAGVAAFIAFGRFFKDQHLSAFVCRSNGRYAASAAKADDDNVILCIPADGVGIGHFFGMR